MLGLGPAPATVRVVCRMRLCRRCFPRLAQQEGLCAHPWRVSGWGPAPGVHGCHLVWGGWAWSAHLLQVPLGKCGQALLGGGSSSGWVLGPLTHGCPGTLSWRSFSPRAARS